MKTTLSLQLTMAALSWFACVNVPACEPDNLRKNVDWLKQNNQDSVNQMRKGCNQEFGTAELNLANIIDGFKNGQQHNPSAQRSIDGCSLPQLIDNVCRRL